MGSTPREEQGGTNIGNIPNHGAAYFGPLNPNPRALTRGGTPRTASPQPPSSPEMRQRGGGGGEPTRGGGAGISGAPASQERQQPLRDPLLSIPTPTPTPPQLTGAGRQRWDCSGGVGGACGARRGGASGRAGPRQRKLRAGDLRGRGLAGSAPVRQQSAPDRCGSGQPRWLRPARPRPGPAPFRFRFWRGEPKTVGVHTGGVPEVGESRYPPSVSLSRMAEEEPRQGGDPQGDAPCSGVLDVGGFPPNMEVELLVLYFESHRRSGGGPVQGWQRHGPHLTITFQDPRGGGCCAPLVTPVFPPDAQRVLARSPHRLEGAELRVALAPPWDPSRLLLGGLNSATPLELLEPHLGTLLGRPPGTFTLSRGPAGWGLLNLHDPLTPQELAVVEQQVQCWGPEGARVQLQRVPRTPQVLVRAAVPGLSHDLLELYFENRRSGGGSVSDVKVLPGRQAAIVTFQQLDVAERVLERQHQLQGMVLSVEPHYSFLGAPEGDETPVPGETLSLGTANTPGTSTSPDTVPPVPAKLEQTEPAVPSPMPGELPDAITGGHKDTEGDEAVARRWQCPEQAATVLASARDEALVLAQDAALVPPAVAQEEMLELAALAQDEVLVAAEPGAVRYLQWHYQDLLGSIPEVSLVPLEGDDVAGFRVSCRKGPRVFPSSVVPTGARSQP
ncbi:protein mono-ADP-ribosyltransferase PARP10-like [Dryobates pubescens]|uniref:protein mono-ADP-ribosyltransferase PARP10-like n=1 Tax=Dryobates pubescens TaxID=118200 RepID=UPI0023B9E32D|nr:protein mono-ADP-ribosyltransferase PARP10-like [Dryobates pubescens]